MAIKLAPVLVVSTRMNEHAQLLRDSGALVTVTDQVTTTELADGGRRIAEIDMGVPNFGRQLSLLFASPNIACIFVYFEYAAVQDSALTSLLTEYGKFDKLVAFRELPSVRTAQDKITQQIADSLSARHLEVVACLAQGCTSNEQIAARLSISEGTVKSHLSRISRKLGLEGDGVTESTRCRIIAFAAKYLPLLFVPES